MIALCIAAYLAVGAAVAFAMDKSFDFGKPIDPGAGSSPSFRWLILPVIALFWPLAPAVAILAVVSWMNSGSH